MIEPKAIELATIARESFDTFYADAQALLHQHWRELATYPDIPLSVDETVYRRLEAAEQLVVITLRTSGVLCGYALFLLRRHPHYQASLQALEDVIYIAPALRRLGLGRTLLRETETILRGLGCQTVIHGVKLAHPALGELLEAEGYTPVERVYSKRLDT